MRMKPFLLILLVAVMALGNFAWWWWASRPITLDQPFQALQTSEDKFASLSFAPFRRGQSPLTKVYPTPEQIEEDIRQVAQLSHGIRTYTSREGMEVVPDLARKYGLEVTFSAWLGHEPPRDPKEANINPEEISALIKAANAHPDVIKRVIVGNEVLLRRDLPVERLIDYIRQVKASVSQPVSYADVWAFYLKYPQVADEVDFLTIHILPYWEDEPRSVQDAEEHLIKIVDLMKKRFPGKPILIGEAGWPTNGRNRGPAIANIENAAHFVRTLAHVSAREGFDYNVVEAFDQPWKAKMEGTVGANWGLIDSNRQMKFALSGPIEPLPDWSWRALAAIGLGSLAALLFARREKTLSRAVGIVALAHIVSICAVTMAFQNWSISYEYWQMAWTGAKALATLAIAWMALRLAAGHDLSHGWRRVPLFIAIAAILWTGCLAFDGRYRDIPVVDFLVPVAALIGLAALRGGVALSVLVGAEPMTRRLCGAVAILLIVSAMAALIGEGFSIVGEDFLIDHPTRPEQAALIGQAMLANREMMAWAAMVAILAIPFWAEARLSALKQRVQLQKA